MTKRSSSYKLRTMTSRIKLKSKQRRLINCFLIDRQDHSKSMKKIQTNLKILSTAGSSREICSGLIIRAPIRINKWRSLAHLKTFSNVTKSLKVSGF